jgi:uncharacterized protein YqgC (DUF456 family)
MTIKLFFRWAAWLLVLAIAVSTLSPIELRPTTDTPANLERFVAFAVIGVCFGLGYPRHQITILLVVIGLIGVLEVAQDLVPSRHGRLHHGFVKAAGALLGLGAAILIKKRLFYSGAYHNRDDTVRSEQER